MISRKMVYSHGSPRIKTTDLNKILKKHGLIKSYKQQMIISMKIIHNQESSRINTKDLDKFIN